MIHSFTAVIILAAGFLIYRSLKPGQFQIWKFFRDEPGYAGMIYLRRTGTAFIYGGLSVLAIVFSGSDPEKYGMKFQNAGFTVISGFLTGCLLTLVVFLNHRKPDNLASFPEIRTPVWSAKTLFLSAITWIIYLLGYEILFRGYLLFSMVDFSGKWLAILINVILYSLVHFHKGWKEAAGAVPLGIGLCLLCLKAGSFWPAFIAHVLLALSNEWLSLKAHPDIRIRIKSVL